MMTEGRLGLAVQPQVLEEEGLLGADQVDEEVPLSLRGCGRGSGRRSRRRWKRGAAGQIAPLGRAPEGGTARGAPRSGYAAPVFLLTTTLACTRVSLLPTMTETRPGPCP